MNDFVAHIAEVEGIKTPVETRTNTEVVKAFESFTEKRKGKRSAKTEKAERTARVSTKKGKSDKPAENPAEVAKTPAVSIVRETISTNAGHTSTAGYDETSKTMHVEFSKGNVYAYPETPVKDWTDWQATFADAEINSGNHFRKAFRGRKYVRVNEPAAAKAAPAVNPEVSA